MRNRINTYQAFLNVFVRECKTIITKPIYLFAMVGAPLFCYLLFTTMMDKGLPTGLPIGVVDMDHSSNSRALIRNLGTFELPKIEKYFANINEATYAMQNGEVYGFYYIPPRFSQNVNAQRQPKLSFYTNNAVLIAGSLLYKDFKMMSELASGAAIRKVLYMKGVPERQTTALLQPIVIDTHPLGNPWINYSVYLNNTLVPGMLMIMIFMITVYSIAVEIKLRTARQWLHMGNNSIWTALLGKLLPQTVIFFIMGTFYNVYLYGVLHFPCNSGIGSMLLATLCFILACQSMGIFMIGVLPTLRYGLSFATLWGVVSFSISGFSFPVMGMHPTLQVLSNLFPLRHYFLIYADQALNGFPMVYSWRSYLALLLFMMLPFLIANRLKAALIYYKYIP